jgi:hypothetical protein
VSSREQEREGFSLEVQEDALRRYATQAGGEITKFFRIAETASKGDERKTFRELVAYAKKNAGVLDGLLFYKVDRAARNLFDYVELERLESEYDLPFISVSQPTENTPAGRMMRRTLAKWLLTEQQSVDVCGDPAAQAAVCGLPHGYRNIRKDGASSRSIQPPLSLRIFHLYATRTDARWFVDRINLKAGFRQCSQFPQSSVHNILGRAYIGELSTRRMVSRQARSAD